MFSPMKRSRGAAALVVVLLSIILLAACSSKPANVSSAPSTSSAGGKEEAAKGSEAQKKTEKTVAEIAQYQGKDREQMLIEGAKKEGVVNLYTSMNVEDAKRIVAAFEKKYGIKLNMWRGLSDEVSKRVIEEARAKRVEMDVTESNGPELELITREKLTQPFYSPYLQELSSASIPAHKNWAATRFNFFVMGYNTKLVKPEEVPKTYEDLLNPKWKGQIALEVRDAPWFGMFFKLWGEQKASDYFDKLAKQNLQARKGHSVLVNVISAGEIAISPTVYNHNAEQLKKDGAPIDWKPLDPAIAEPSGVLLAKNAKHPYASMLLIDFLISKDGQQIFADAGRIPSNTKIETKMNKFNFVMSDPSIQLDEFEKWDKLFQKLFKK